MSRKLNSFRFVRQSVYNWDAWLDGEVNVLVRGTEDQVEAETADYTAEPKSIEMQARSKGKERGLTIRCKVGVAADLLTPEQMTELAITPATELCILQAYVKPVKAKDGEGEQPSTLPIGQTA